MHVRTATEADSAILAKVFFRAVREGPSPYTEAQRRAWRPEPYETSAFSKRLRGQYVVLGEDSARIFGFMSVEAGGYIDLAYILPEARGRGLFRALFSEIEREARARGEALLRTHASLMAQPAFRAMGFEVMHHETVELDGQLLARALMEKTLK